MAEWCNIGKSVANLFLLPMSSRYLESALMKSENRRGESTLPWVTPVLKVILHYLLFPVGDGP